MSSTDDTLRDLTTRLEDLEVRYAYLERLMSDLDGIVRETADELTSVRKVVVDLHRRAEAEKEQLKFGSPEDEKPPHY